MVSCLFFFLQSVIVWLNGWAYMEKLGCIHSLFNQAIPKSRISYLLRHDHQDYRKNTINVSIVLLLPLTSVPGDIPSILLLLVLNHRVILFRGGLWVLPLHNFSFDQQTCSECRRGRREMLSPAPCWWDDSVKTAKERDLITKAGGRTVFGGRVSPRDRLLKLFCWHLCLISLIFSSQPEDRDGAFVRLPCSSTDPRCRRINL